VRLEPMTSSTMQVERSRAGSGDLAVPIAMIRTARRECATYMESALELQRGGTSLPFVTHRAIVQDESVGSTRFGKLTQSANRRIEIGWTWLAQAPPVAA